MRGLTAGFKDLMKLTGVDSDAEQEGGPPANRSERQGAPGVGRLGEHGSWLWKAATAVAIATAAILADCLVQAGAEKGTLLEQLAKAESVRDEFSRLPMTRYVPAHGMVQGPLQSKLRPEFQEIVTYEEKEIIFDTCTVKEEEEEFRRQSWRDVWTDYFGKEFVQVKVDWANPHPSEPDWATRMRIYQDELCEYGQGIEHKIGCQDWWKLRCGRTPDLKKCAKECVQQSREAALSLGDEDPWTFTSES